ncbi:MAG: hypothetical protein V4532_17745 [Pseudomonadota bacterium]|uniref:hypothetical protein n=1 Tax=Aquabacterium sp. CECT 9606 TaxID=2845822 RepID=UPI001E65155A|nr:hypothetical protein [Aquabacterium sp. CECT 9606]CAH0353472.1 hypothetical protein AQB9606_03258 [Aquabacterium sp. CECT 9606]
MVSREQFASFMRSVILSEATPLSCLLGDLHDGAVHELVEHASSNASHVAGPSPAIAIWIGAVANKTLICGNHP